MLEENAQLKKKMNELNEESIKLKQELSNLQEDRQNVETNLKLKIKTMEDFIAQVKQQKKWDYFSLILLQILFFFRLIFEQQSNSF